MMQRRVVTVCLCISLSGCSFIWGAAGAYDIPDRQLSDGDQPCQHWGPPTLDLLGGALFTPAIVSPVFFIALPAAISYYSSFHYGVRRYSECEDAPRQQRLALARDLRAKAAAAARVDDCTTVDALDRTVCSLDPTFHADTFVRDPDIVRCPGVLTSVQRCKYETCVVARWSIFQQMKTTTDGLARHALLARAPKCDALKARSVPE